MNALPTSVPEPNAPAYPRDALVHVEWPRVLFIHYRVPPELLRTHVPRNFEIETYDGSAWLTLVALTMRNFRACRPWSPIGSLLRLRGEQRFLNVRTYVRQGPAAGALFLWGWLSRPLNVPLPRRPFGLPCGFADITYKHSHEQQQLDGKIRSGDRRLTYSASIAGSDFSLPKRGSLAEFTLERYNGFYSHRGLVRIFRASHEPWRSVAADVRMGDDSLLQTLPCFAHAKFATAHYTPGLPKVCLGQPRKLETRHCHHGPSSFFTMP